MLPLHRHAAAQAFCICAFLLAATTRAQSITALNDCHMHDGTIQYCLPLPTGSEVVVTTASNSAAALPTSYSGCHMHGSDILCVDNNGNDVGPIKVASSSMAAETGTHEGGEHAAESGAEHDGETAEEHATHAGEGDEEATGAGQTCHFHAGVEYCTGGSAKAAGEQSCKRVARDYNLPLRIGSIFIVLATSTLSVAIPLLVGRYTSASMNSWVMMGIKQFGTGVIIATAFVHLLTHAQLMFSNPCVGDLGYEATTTVIVMAGIFLAFLVEFVGDRVVTARRAAVASEASSMEVHSEVHEDSKAPASGDVEHRHTHLHTQATDQLSVAVMEAGIIFHSVLIGLTLVVAGDSTFVTLLVVIIFHQGFEGLALSARIAALHPTTKITGTKLIMAAAFAVITPIGMSIGVGVRNYFNGSDKETLIALGVLDALSAGILVWVGVVEMWAHDWVWSSGGLRTAGLAKTLWAGLCLVSGFGIMGFLGKYA